MCAHLYMLIRLYPAEFYYSSSVWEQDQTKVERIISYIGLNFSWECRTSWTGSGAYVYQLWKGEMLLETWKILWLRPTLKFNKQKKNKTSLRNE